MEESSARLPPASVCRSLPAGPRTWRRNPIAPKKGQTMRALLMLAVSLLTSAATLLPANAPAERPPSDKADKLDVVLPEMDREDGQLVLQPIVERRFVLEIHLNLGGEHRSEPARVMPPAEDTMT